MEKLCIGVDVGGTSVKVGVFTITGQLKDKWEVATRKIEDGKYILTDTAASIRDWMDQHRIDKEQLIGCGIGVPGPVMPDGNVELCVNLGWRDCYPAKQLSGLLDGIPVCCANDANVAALGEMWQGGGKGCRDMMMITLGTGVGGGLISNGRIHSGVYGLAGEIGHICVKADEQEQCNCGGYGCLEQLASATGVVRVARQLLQGGAEDSILRSKGERLSAKDVFDAAKDHDSVAGQAVGIMCSYLGQVMSQVTMIADPKRFVIGGGVSMAGEFLIVEIIRHYDRFMALSEKRAEVKLAELGNDAGIYGAAKLMLD